MESRQLGAEDQDEDEQLGTDDEEIGQMEESGSNSDIWRATDSDSEDSDFDDDGHETQRSKTPERIYRWNR